MSRIILLFLTLIPLSGAGTACFHNVVIRIRHFFLRPDVCLTSTLLETGVGTPGLRVDWEVTNNNKRLIRLEELDGPAVNALGEVKQRWSVIG
jgi:hypothetical protein